MVLWGECRQLRGTDRLRAEDVLSTPALAMPARQNDIVGPSLLPVIRRQAEGERSMFGSKNWVSDGELSPHRIGGKRSRWWRPAPPSQMVNLRDDLKAWPN